MAGGNGVESFRVSNLSEPAGLPGVSELSSRRRALACQKFYSSRLDEVDVVPVVGECFEAALSLTQLGPIRIVRMGFGGGSIQRTVRHVGRPSQRQYTLLLQVRGRATLEHYGEQCLLREGDLALCDSAAPHVYRLVERAELLMLRIDADLLKAHLPSPEIYCGQRLAAQCGVTHAVTSLIRSLCEQLESGNKPGFPDRIARNLLDMVATAYAIAFSLPERDAPPAQTSSYAKVRLFIEQHLRDPSLSPSSVARDLKLSSRYVRMMFAANKDSASAYILRRRLEECERQLGDPAWRDRSIMEIAFAWGFNSAPHFARSFRDRFGDSPRGYRRLRMGGCSPPEQVSGQA